MITTIAAAAAAVAGSVCLALVCIVMPGLSGVRAPGTRNETHDFVREGLLLSK